MACPHSSSSGPCSSCMGAVAKRVELVGGVVVVDGESVARETYAGPSPQYVQAGKRGARKVGDARRKHGT